MKRVFWIIFSIILATALALSLVPRLNNNFYFTVDQGNDAVYVREILEGKEILLRGPETGIRNVHAGPLWYYFIGIGYLLFAGNPFGAVFMLTMLKILVTVFLMLRVKERVGAVPALALGAALQFYWWYSNASHWAFNPFPLVSLGIILTLLSVDFLAGSKKEYFWGFVPIFFAFNAEVAGAVAFFLYYIVIGIIGVARGILSRRELVLTSLVTFLAGVSYSFLEFLAQAMRVKVFLLPQRPGPGIFSGFNFAEMSQEFLKIFSNAVIPQSILASILIYALSIVLFTKFAKKNKFILNFFLSTLVLFLVSFIFFSSNKGWWDWHTVYISPLLFISLFLITVSVPKIIGIPLLAVIMFFQLQVFKERYTQYFSPLPDDPSILANQIKVLDWIYNKSENDGFNAYTYTPHVYDYPYQYLFWWYGREKYGFVPCEYSYKAGALKSEYVPGHLKYTKPTLGCDKFRFLIIEPDKDGKGFKSWYEEASVGTRLVESTLVARIKIEKRIVQNY